MSLVSMESSNPTSLIERNKQIILKHLGNLDEKILETFKKALCQLKPRGAAGPITMGKLKYKSLKEIVDFIFTYHTENHGTQTVRKALQKINETQTRMLIDKDLRKATERRRSMEPKKSEASTSKVMVDKQGGKQVHPSAPKMMVPTAPPVPRSEPSAKKVERAVLEAPKNKEGTARNPPRPASTSKVMVDKQGGKQVHPSAPKMMVPTAPPVPRSEPSAKKVEREQDRDAVPEATKNKEGTASKNEEPAHNPPRPASTSKVMVDKQDGKQVHPSAPTTMVPTAPPVPRSELSAKKVEIEQVRDAVPEATKNKEGTASKNEGPAHNPLTPATHRRKSMEPKKIEASTSKVMVDKQDGNVVTETVIIIDDDDDDDYDDDYEPFSEPSAKKIKVEPDRDAVLGVPENKEGPASKNEGPAHNPPRPEQSEKAPPTISMEKETSNIIVTHLEKLKDGDIEKFKEILCLMTPPIKRGQIDMRDIIDKSLEEMVDLIIRRHTLRRGPATVRKVLEHMKENHTKMMIQKDIRTLNQKKKQTISSTSLR